MACSQGEGACCPANPGQATWVMSLSDSVAQQAKKPIHITSSLLVLLMALRLSTSPSGAAKVALPGTK